MNARAIALIAASLACCGVSALPGEVDAGGAAPFSLPEPGIALLLAIALAGLARFGGRRKR